jgi:predicted 3-demethylubiquinone-9 3-methyltransferase (glyoxalase superfamily)
MQKITPHLWFDKEAKEAAHFYVSVFGGDSKVGAITTLTGTPSGDADIVPFTLWGYEFLSISAGPYFKPTPAISFMVNFDPSQMKDAEKRIDEMWAKLSEGGKALMPLDKYPFSERYGWIQDKYGFSWQLILTDPKGEPRPPIIPSLLYITDECEAAEEATNFYLSVFKNSKRGMIARYPAGMEPNKEGAIMFTDFTLEGQWFAAMDGSAKMHNFKFNEAVSLIVNCEDQAEIDYYWEKLSAVPEAEQCGWLKDKYGVSWQIAPQEMNEMMATKDKAALERVTKAFLPMKKFDLAKLKKAYKG